jgi:hypothetical protein
VSAPDTCRLAMRAGDRADARQLSVGQWRRYGTHVGFQESTTIVDDQLGIEHIEGIPETRVVEEGKLVHRHCPHTSCYSWKCPTIGWSADSSTWPAV